MFLVFVYSLRGTQYWSGEAGIAQYFYTLLLTNSHQYQRQRPPHRKPVKTVKLNDLLTENWSRYYSPNAEEADNLLHKRKDAFFDEFV